MPQRLPAGPATIEMTYTGILNDKLRGFYISKANGRNYAVTQMEATDARRAFPSFDEPAFKATFDVSMMIDSGDTAISNGAQLSDTPGPEPGKHTVTFARTPKMSTYLVAMLVGDFVCRDGVRRRHADPRLLDARQARAHRLRARSGASSSSQFYNDYFGITYPFGKLDIIAVPDFAAGAMENAGAITFRERLLLVDPERASLGVRKNIAAVISHEIAHQWFGDLVTMKWWDDIWLNEGFATWMANKPLAEWQPEWHVELDDVEDTLTAVGDRCAAHDAADPHEGRDAGGDQRGVRRHRLRERLGGAAHDRGLRRAGGVPEGSRVVPATNYSYGECRRRGLLERGDARDRQAGRPHHAQLRRSGRHPGADGAQPLRQRLDERRHPRQERFSGTAAVRNASAAQLWSHSGLRDARPAAARRAARLVEKREQTLTVPGCTRHSCGRHPRRRRRWPSHGRRARQPRQPRLLLHRVPARCRARAGT